MIQSEPRALGAIQKGTADCDCFYVTLAEHDLTFLVLLELLQGFDRNLATRVLWTSLCDVGGKWARDERPRMPEVQPYDIVV